MESDVRNTKERCHLAKHNAFIVDYTLLVFIERDVRARGRCYRWPRGGRPHPSGCGRAYATCEMTFRH